MVINHTTVCQSFTCGCTHSLFPFFPSPWAKPLPLLAPLTVPLGGWWNLSLLSALTFSAGDVLGCGVCYLLGAAKPVFHCSCWAKAVLQVCSIYSGNKTHVADQGVPARGAAEPGFIAALHRGVGYLGVGPPLAALVGSELSWDGSWVARSEQKKPEDDVPCGVGNARPAARCRKWRRKLLPPSHPSASPGLNTCLVAPQRSQGCSSMVWGLVTVET